MRHDNVSWFDLPGPRTTNTGATANEALRKPVVSIALVLATKKP
jgi:hypothetical protein